MWHCHRLAPFRYASYCAKRFGGSKPLEQNPPFKCSFHSCDGKFVLLNPADMDREVTATAAARNLWNELYPDEPYDFLPSSKDGVRRIDESPASILLDEPSTASKPLPPRKQILVIFLNFSMEKI